MSCRLKRTDVQVLHEELVYKRFLSFCSKSYENNVFWLYRTRFMLDELGNLQSDGHGIQGFQTMLSIGLG